MPKVMITGANRGIGRAMLDLYVARGWDCIATSRQDMPTQENVTWVNLDVRDPHSHQTIEGPLDLLICNAGVYLNKGATIGNGFSASDWSDTMAANVTGVYLTIEAQLDAVRQSKAGKIAIISSQMASSTNAPGGSYIYRASKAAALNLGRNLSSDLKSEGIAVGIYHPGWVQTDMGGGEADIDVATASNGLIARFEELSIETTGCFETWDGRAHPY